MRNLKLFTTILSLGLLVTAFVPFARADAVNELTIVTFNQPVEIPGMVLPPGKYIFQLADPDNSPNVVEVLNAKTDKVYETFIGMPDQRSEATNRADFIFTKAGNNSPMRLKAWFYPGYDEGLQFVYPKQK